MILNIMENACLKSNDTNMVGYKYYVLLQIISKSCGLDQCGLSLMIKTETSRSCETETRPRVLPMSISCLDVMLGSEQ